MAVTIIPLGIGGNALRIIRDADVDATAENNVNDGAATVYAVTIDNTANAAREFVKFYNVAAPTVGTTDPDMILFIPLSVSRTFVFKTGNSFATALSYAAVTAGGTAGTTGPVSDVIMNIVVS